MNYADLLPSYFLGILEGKAENTFGRFSRDELNALHNAIHHNMLNSRIFSLSVFSNEDSLDIVIWSLVASDRPSRSDVCEKIKGTAKSKVEGNMAFADRCLQTSLIIVLALNGISQQMELTASGPLRATKFFFTLSIALSGMAVFPSLITGVTSTGSQFIGT